MAEQAELVLPVVLDELKLRAITNADSAHMVRYFSDPEVCRYIPWEPREIEGVLKFISERVSTKIPTESGQHLIVGIELKDFGLIGQLNFTLTDATERTGEFGYVINPELSGRGYATKAVSAFITLLFDQLNIRRATAWIDERNLPSIALVERLGLRRESREVEVEFFIGVYVTLLRYAILSHEWPC